MNRGVLQLQSSPIMAAGNPNWPWNINSTGIRSPQPLSPLLAASAPPTSSFLFGQYYAPTSAPPLPFPPTSWTDLNQDFPESMSLSQLMIMGGLVGDGSEKSEMNSLFQAANNKLMRLDNWEEQLLVQNSPNNASSTSIVDVKQEDSGSSAYPPYNGHHANNNSDHFQGNNTSAKSSTSNWPSTTPMATSASSPKSSVTSLNNSVLDFSSKKADGRHPPPDRSSEGNSNAVGSGSKKAKVQPSSGAQSTFKVRKEKLGDRISALHQLVSPFGKTDTASVLLEAIGYVRFLHNQIEALSMPYLGNNASGNMRHPSQHVQGERNCIFPEDPGQLLNGGNCMKRKGAFEQDPEEEGRRDLRSRGLCLVPVSCTLQVGSSDNGADYWASAFGGGFQ